jgi:hypothetical protein
MKRAWLWMVLVLAGSSVLRAQEPLHPWTWELQGGYNTAGGWLDSGWMAQTGIGYAWTDYVSVVLHGAYYQGNLKGISGSNALYVLTVAPELRRPVSDHGEVYVFMGAGVAGTSSSYSGRGWQRIHLPSQTKWAGEAGIGYRHFFSRQVGMSFQVTYTHMAFEPSVDVGDGRVGLVIRF